MFDTVTSVATTVSLMIILAALLWVAYQRWAVADTPQRQELVEGAIKRLVEAAEQIHNQPASGNAKFGWVMNRLVRRFPDHDWDELDELVQQAVHHLNRDKAMRDAIIHRNGTQGSTGNAYSANRSAD